MFRAWLRVARPDDWTGSLTKAGAMIATGLLLVIPTLARLPKAWVELALGQEWAVRVVLVVASLWLLMQVRAFVYAGLPGSVVLLRRRVRIPGRLRGRWLRIEKIRDVHVDLRPEGEVFVLELDDGSELDMCNVAWEGAGRVYAKLAARLPKRRRRARTRTQTALPATSA